MATEVTKAQARAAVDLIFAASEVLREKREMPSGHLYAALMQYVDLAGYNAVIGILKRADLVSEENHVLRWIGPELGGSKDAVKP